jgi:hypothetical protein
MTSMLTLAPPTVTAFAIATPVACLARPLGEFHGSRAIASKYCRFLPVEPARPREIGYADRHSTLNALTVSDE